MTAAETALVAFAAAGAVTFVLTPASIRIARRTGFLDHPRDYRKHDSPTPFLGGTAVLFGFLIAAAIIAPLPSKLLVLLGWAVAMWLLGTLDDRIAVAPKWRVLAAAAAAVSLNRAGLGWTTSAGTVVDIVLAIAWVVGLVNALNLMDNLDGACGTVACVAAAGIGLLAAIKGDTPIAGLAFALSGACAGFLPWNLCRPARIFLGDGGSMPIGFLLAALAMATSRHAQGGNAGLLVGALLVGLPILDVTLVSLSRTRRGVSLMTGGRDHLTHRVLLKVNTPRRVGALLAVGQGCLCGLAIAGYELGAGAVIGFAFAAFVASIAAILVLDTEGWRPPGIASGSDPEFTSTQASPTSVGADSG